MARLHVTPTRVEMRRLAGRLQIARRGHALLKEKQDSLIQQFISLTDHASTQRRLVEERLSRMYSSYQKASLVSDDDLLQKNLNAAEKTIKIKTRLDSILGIKVPDFEIVEAPESEKKKTFITSFLPKELDNLVTLQEQFVQLLVELAEIEKRCFLLGQEVITTRRRVNALEFKTIPDLEDTISYIRMKIEDTERGQIAKLIQLK